eukprot:m.102839 g.102839  ORF g.102839 m.102839 type:complete len:1092 (-) comp15201_c0_seq1:129-3404(-)
MNDEDDFLNPGNLDLDFFQDPAAIADDPGGLLNDADLDHFVPDLLASELADQEDLLDFESPKRSTPKKRGKKKKTKANGFNKPKAAAPAPVVPIVESQVMIELKQRLAQLKQSLPATLQHVLTADYVARQDVGSLLTKAQAKPINSLPTTSALRSLSGNSWSSVPVPSPSKLRRSTTPDLPAPSSSAAPRRRSASAPPGTTSLGAFRRLSDQDRVVFGMRPMHEEVQLVQCDRCHRAILASRYEAHRNLVSCVELLSPSRGPGPESGLAAPDLAHPEDLLTEFDFDLGQMEGSGSPAKDLELLDLSDLNLFEDGDEDYLPPTSKQQSSRNTTSSRRGNTSEVETHPDRNCAVLDQATGTACHHALTCKQHPERIKRQVIGRSFPFDVLLERWRHYRAQLKASRQSGIPGPASFDPYTPVPESKFDKASNAITGLQSSPKTETETPPSGSQTAIPTSPTKPLAYPRPFGPTPIAQPSFGLKSHTSLPPGATQAATPSHTALATTALWQHALERTFYPTPKRSLACLDSVLSNAKSLPKSWQPTLQETDQVTRMLQPDHVIHQAQAMPTSLDQRLTGPYRPVSVSRRHGPGWHALRACFAARLSNGPVFGKPEAPEVLRKRRHDKWAFEQTLQDKLQRHGSKTHLATLDLLSTQPPHGSPILLGNTTPSPSHPVEAYHNRAFRFDSAGLSTQRSRMDLAEDSVSRGSPIPSLHTPTASHEPHRGSRLNPFNPPVLSTPVDSRSPAVSFHPPLSRGNSFARGLSSDFGTNLKTASLVQTKLQETAPFTHQHDAALDSHLSGDQLAQSRRLAHRKTMATALKAVLTFRLSSGVAPLEPSLGVDAENRCVASDDGVSIPPELLPTSTDNPAHDPRRPLADKAKLLTAVQRRALRVTAVASPQKRRASRRPSSPGKHAKRTVTPTGPSPSSHETSMTSPLVIDSKQTDKRASKDDAKRASKDDAKRQPTSKTGRPRKKVRAQPRTPKPGPAAADTSVSNVPPPSSGSDFLAVLTSEAPSLEDLERLIGGDLPNLPDNALSLSEGGFNLAGLTPPHANQVASSQIPPSGVLDLDQLDLEELDIDLDTLMPLNPGQGSI